MCKLTWIVLVLHSRLHFVNICLASRCSHLLAVPSSLRKAPGTVMSPSPPGPGWRCLRKKTLRRKPQVSLTAPKTNGLWLAAVTNSLIIDFMILRLKLLYNNIQKCLMGSIQSHKNYLLNKRFKTINLLFSINNGSPKNRRQLNVSTAFLPEKGPFNRELSLPRLHGLAGYRAADAPRTDLGSTGPRKCFKDVLSNPQGGPERFS